MTLSRSNQYSYQLKTWSYKRCLKCGRNTKYDKILDLYLLKDREATWICDYCQYSETIQIEELLLK
ncbi:MAG: hypothetical protein AAGE84_23115 [Cyanobacteria bacterium P01_G01_bin.39]